jgi:prepilin-type N-terminal cleavage/methylation domain-containing protein
MSERGFTLVELLVAAVISLFITAGALLLAGAGRTAVTVEPAALDAVRRLRDGVGALSSAVASAGGEIGIGDARGALNAGMPALRLTRSAGAAAFDGLDVTRVVRGGRGLLRQPQDGPAGSLSLDAAAGHCPLIDEVCGFTAGDVAVVFDGRGHHDVFIVFAVSQALMRVTPSASLRHTYPAGSVVVEARHERFVPEPQADGLRTLTRVTAAGAREPMVDGVVGVRMSAWGRAAPPGLADGDADGSFAQYGLRPPSPGAVDPEGIFAAGEHCLARRDAGLPFTTLAPLAEGEDGLAQLTEEDLTDGPWCPHSAAADRFDADWFRVRRVDVELDVAVLVPQLRGATGRLFAVAGTGAHAPSTWVHDRRLRFRVAVGR